MRDVDDFLAASHDSNRDELLGREVENKKTTR